jgi:excisionase family DNA binding protein
MSLVAARRTRLRPRLDLAVPRSAACFGTVIFGYPLAIIAVMAKQRKRRADETAALFVRLPVEEAEKLDRFAFERRVPKRDIVRWLVSERLDDADVLWRQPLPPPPVPLVPPGEVVVGRADFVPADAPDVLTVEQAAELLQAYPDAVRELAAAGELPGRQIAGEWRFLRRAVLAWLGGGEGAGRE